MKFLTADVMQGFVGSVLSKRFDGSKKSPECHYEWWDLCCSSNRNVAIAAPRGHAKSTAITFSFTLACILFRERQFVVIVSDTEAQAAGFLSLIKNELVENPDIKELFKLKKNEQGQIAFLKESETDLIGQFEDGTKFRIIAKGSEQKLRGLLWNGSRPDLIMCDDMENDEIVMNKDRRDKFKRWFMGALMPCRSANGVVRYVGTILHMDSLLENLMPVESDRQTIVEDIRVSTPKKTAWRSIKYRAHNKDFSQILWPAQWPAEALKAEKQMRDEQGLSDVYAMEFLNVPIDVSSAYFKRDDFQVMREDDYTSTKNYYITVDLAISQKEKSDYSVFLVAGVDQEKRIHVVNIVRDRLDGQDIVNTLIQLHKTYNPVGIGIEEGQISKSIGPFLNEAMHKENEYLNLYPMKHMALDKPTRAKSMQARMRAKGVKFDKKADWYQTFEDECLRFPRDKHDDQVDAFAYLGLLLNKLIEAPTPKEEAEQEYIENMYKSEMLDLGRYESTGY